MPRETLLLQVNEVSLPPDMEPDEDDYQYYEQLTGRAGNWELNQKPRPFHKVARLLTGVFYNLMCWVGLAGLIFCGYKFNQTEERRWMELALVSLVTFLIFQVARYSNGMSLHCPLCHGTPLFEKNCRKHRLANKFGFMNYRASTVLSIVTRAKFNCMYCGTPFRLRK